MQAPATHNCSANCGKVYRGQAITRRNPV